MGEEDDLGSPGIAKSVRSLVEALVTFEREAEMILGHASAASAANAATYFAKLVTATGRRAVSSVDLPGLIEKAMQLDVSALTRLISAAFGLADEASLEEVRSEVRDVVEQVSRLRERELAVAGGVSQLRARAARFEEALAGLARVQGKCVARLDGQVDRGRALENLAARRDDHITRLIRDTAGQRAELERVARDLDAVKQGAAEAPGRDTSQEITEIRAKIGQLETHYGDLKKLQSGSAQRVIDTLESLRDRVSKLEARAAEMSREARAKAGRLDALARHVATVEGRLTSAIGKPGDPIVAVSSDVDRPLSATG
jgi:chromosome segregation ATPase